MKKESCLLYATTCNINVYWSWIGILKYLEMGRLLLEQLLIKIDKNWKELLVNPFLFTDEMNSLAMLRKSERRDEILYLR